MKVQNIWESAKGFPICVDGEITGGFDVGFDAQIPETTKDALMQFVYWVEDNFSMPVTLWVDFKYRKYLIDQAGKRSGYRFWYVDFENYPQFDNPDDIPVIELAVNRPVAEILPSFIEAITRYYVWLAGEKCGDFKTDPVLIEAILRRCQKEKKC